MARDAVELFYLVCPERFLAELEPEVLDSFDAVLTETGPVGPDEDAPLAVTRPSRYRGRAV